jgi:hypothetical protein
MLQGSLFLDQAALSSPAQPAQLVLVPEHALFIPQ